ncbi:MAG: hypothetical protein PF448_07095 [Bacteroidales bacterium]|nr:hypothetical protein [Bacteroidales bacterium]
MANTYTQIHIHAVFGVQNIVCRLSHNSKIWFNVNSYEGNVIPFSHDT